MKTAEQTRAFERFELLVRPAGLRVTEDDDGFPIVSGTNGRIEWHDPEQLAVYSSRPRLFAMLRAIPGIRTHQLGDREARFLFGLDGLADVARVIKARRRRIAPPPSQAQVEARSRFADAGRRSASRTKVAVLDPSPTSTV